MDNYFLFESLILDINYYYLVWRDNYSIKFKIKWITIIFAFAQAEYFADEDLSSLYISYIDDELCHRKTNVVLHHSHLRWKKKLFRSSIDLYYNIFILFKVKYKKRKEKNKSRKFIIESNQNKYMIWSSLSKR